MSGSTMVIPVPCSPVGSRTPALAATPSPGRAPIENAHEAMADAARVEPVT